MTTEARTGREWWPEHFVDEICPEGRDTPDAWIKRLDDGGFACRDDSDPEGWSFKLTEGEIVEFMFCDSLPSFIVTFDAAGKPHYSEPPASANWFWNEDEHECCGDTLDEVIEIAREEAHIVNTVDVGCCHWSKGKHLFRFTALDAPPRFVTVDAEQAAA